MNNYKFKSILKDEIYNFIEFKKSLGYKYNGSETLLKKIDNYWNALGIEKIELSEDDVMNFTKRNDNESLSYYKNRLYLLKHFSLFLVKQGYKNIYVYDYPIKQNKYMQLH